MHETAALRIQLMGEFRVWIADQPIDPLRWRLRKAATLIKLLALAPNHRVLRDRVLFLLWPDFDQVAANNNLYQVLHVARRALTRSAAGPTGPVLDADYIALWPDGPVDVDVEHFEAAVARARRTQEPADLRAALALVSGELLPADRYEDWTCGRRQELTAAQIDLRLGLARLLELRDEGVAAVEEFQRVLDIDNAREEAHMGLMRLYARLGNRQGALRQYRDLCAVMTRDLAAEPSPAAVQLYEGILAGNVPEGIPGAASTSRAAPPTRHNLPAPLTGFVGRTVEMRTIMDRLEAGDAGSAAPRLFTLTGAGGCGKTRLALQVARDVLSRYPDGVWFVDLAPIRDSRRLADACCAALQLRRAARQNPQAALIQHLQNKRVLLIVDNCEHLVEAAAEWVADVLQACPDLTVMATSRETLGIAGEAVFRVPSLKTPDPQQWSLVALDTYDAIRLFVTRAHDVTAEFELTAECAPAVVAICSDLDGMPLAIELAAARLSSLRVEQIATRLSDRFRLLRGGPRNDRPNHQTLRALIDWSYDLLTAAERGLLRRLAVFTNGWTLEAAQAVGSEGDVVELLAHLVAKSLVEFVPEPTPRYRLTESVRQYGIERLAEASETEALQDRHLRYFVDLSARAEPWLRSAQMASWLDSLEADLDNVRSALAWGLESDAHEALRLVSALLWFWHIRSRATEGIEWLRRAVTAATGVDRPQSRDDASLLAKGLTALASLLWFSVNARDARVYLDESRRLLEEQGSERRDLLAHTYLRLAEMEQDAAIAQPLLSRALHLAVEAEDLFCVAECHKSLSLAGFHDGRYGEALTSLAAAETRFAAIGDQDGLGTVHLYRGHCYFALRNWTCADTSYQVAREHYRSVDNITYAQISICFQAWAQFWRGDHVRARQIWDTVLSAAVSTGDQLVIARCAHGLGVLAWTEHRHGAATAHIAEALAIVRQTGLEAGGGVAAQHHVLGDIALSAGDDEQAGLHYEAERAAAAQGSEPLARITAAYGLARLSLNRDDVKTAHLQVSEALAEPMDSMKATPRRRAIEATALLWAGRVALASGDLDESAAYLTRSLELQPCDGFMQYSPDTIPIIAHARLFESFALLAIAAAGSHPHARRTRLERAAELLAASEALHNCRFAMSPRECADVDHADHRLREALGSADRVIQALVDRDLLLLDARALCRDMKI